MFWTLHCDTQKNVPDRCVKLFLCKFRRTTRHFVYVRLRNIRTTIKMVLGSDFVRRWDHVWTNAEYIQIPIPVLNPVSQSDSIIQTQSLNYCTLIVHGMRKIQVNKYIVGWKYSAAHLNSAVNGDRAVRPTLQTIDLPTLNEYATWRCTANQESQWEDTDGQSSPFA